MTRKYDIRVQADLQALQGVLEPEWRPRKVVDSLVWSDSEAFADMLTDIAWHVGEETPGGFRWYEPASPSENVALHHPIDVDVTHGRRMVRVGAFITTEGPRASGAPTHGEGS